MSIEDFIITVYCLVEENMATVVGNRRLRQRGFAPKLTDSEVITLEVVGEFLGLDTDKGIWCYFREHWLAWFPALGSRTAFVKQSSHLWRVKQQMQALLVKSLGGYDDIWQTDSLFRSVS